jgi:glutathione synthase
MTTIKLGVIMDPISAIHYKKDSTLAMLWEAKHRGWEIYYFEVKDLFLCDGKVYGFSRLLTVFQDPAHWFDLSEEKIIPLHELNIILMRKDPPFDSDYLYATQLLDLVEKTGVLVANKPQSLRDANEKLFATWFPQCCPSILVTKKISELKKFFHGHKEIVCKPLNAMGGHSVFYLREGDKNAAVIFEVMTQHETQFIMAQQFIPEIREGDKRILMIDGEPIPYALARIPMQDDMRGNLAAGAKGEVRALTDRDRWICQQVGPTLREKGLYFVGLDVIGDYLAEINVTSPTCIRELDQACQLNISATFFDCLERLSKTKTKS